MINKHFFHINKVFCFIYLFLKFFVFFYVRLLLFTATLKLFNNVILQYYVHFNPLFKLSSPHFTERSINVFIFQEFQWRILPASRTSTMATAVLCLWTPQPRPSLPWALTGPPWRWLGRLCGHLSRSPDLRGRRVSLQGWASIIQVIQLFSSHGSRELNQNAFSC